MTLQLETFTSQFGCVKEEVEGKTQLKIIKYFDLRPENDQKYAGLRSSLFFFKDYFLEKDLPFESIKNCIYKPDTFYRFFSSMQMILDIKKRDFLVALSVGDKRTKTPSLPIRDQGIIIVTELFHKILVVRHWLDEVVRPLRRKISLSSIIDQVWPLVNDISIGGVNNPTEYANMVSKLDFGDFISDRVDRSNCSHYLDTYIALSVDYISREAVEKAPDTSIFRELLAMVDLQNYRAEEAAHLIQIFTHNAPKMDKNTLPEDWK